MNLNKHFPEEYKYLYYTSWSFLPTLLVAFESKIYDLSIITFLVGFISLNFWREPSYSWRREMDMYIVQLGVDYYFVRSFDSSVGYIFCILFLLSLYGFKESLIYYNDKKYGLAVINHGAMHIGTNISIIYLIQSDITPEPLFIDRYIFSLLLLVSFIQYNIISNAV